MVGRQQQSRLGGELGSPGGVVSGGLSQTARQVDTASGTQE